jgi:hypothetical protein
VLGLPGTMGMATVCPRAVTLVSNRGLTAHEGFALRRTTQRSSVIAVSEIAQPAASRRSLFDDLSGPGDPITIDAVAK